MASEKMMRRALSLALALACAAAATPAYSQKVLDVPAAARWQHARSGVILPARIGGFARQSITDNGDEVDIIAQYQDAETRVTLFLYRPQQNDAGLWFDRSERALSENRMLGTITPLDPEIAALSLVDGGPKAALMRRYRGEGIWKNTATIVAPAGTWLLKIRASSASLSGDEIGALARAALAAVVLPAEAGAAARPARIIGPCAEALAFRKRARPAKADIAAAIMANMGAFVTTNEGIAKDGSSGIYSADLCRDPAVFDKMNIYRSPSDPDRYWLVDSDSGSYAHVGKMALSERRYEVHYRTPTASYLLPPFTALPTGEQVTAQIAKGAVTSQSAYDPERAAARAAAEQAAEPPAKTP
jgi:hypothetical protein